MRRPLTITLAWLLAALLITALPRTAAAAPARGTTTAPGSGSAHTASKTVPPGADSARTTSNTSALSAAQSARDACSLTGLVPARGSNCTAYRLRSQWLGIPALPNPVHVVTKVVGGVASTAVKAVALVAILGFVASGAESALKDTAKVIDDTTSPQLTSSWFSASYWRVAGIAALLTIPFLCAAAIHAVVRSDLGLLTRAAFGYLPLSLFAVGIASQLTMLLLAGTDEMSSIIASASEHADSVFLSTTSVEAIVASVADGSPFVTFLAAIITVTATLTLWLELLVRNVAVDVIVLMLPLFFAAMVWPARRILAIRAIETLIALILSKFAIVAVLSLGGAALGHSAFPGAASVLTGGTLVLLAAFTPWALLRMLPLHELASATASGLSEATKQPLSSGRGRAHGFANALAALGADDGEHLALAEGARSILGGGSTMQGRSATDAGPEVADERGWAEPADAGLAEPVIRAMSVPPGGGDQLGSGAGTGSGSASDATAADESAVGTAGDDPGGSAMSQPDAGTVETPRWPDALAFPDALTGDDPELPLGGDLQELADEQGLPAAAATDAQSTRGGASSPSPPVLPAPDAIGPRPAAVRPHTARPEPVEPSPPRVAPPPHQGFDPLDGGDA